MVNFARFVSSIFRTLRVTQAPVRAVFRRLAIVCAFAGWVLPLEALAQNTQIPCPIRTPVNIAAGASLFNNARCNVDAGLTIQVGGSFVNLTFGTLLIGDDQMPPVFNALVLNAGTLANDGVMIIEPMSGSLINMGTLNNAQLELFNYHTLLNNGTFNNLDAGDFLNRDAGTFNNLKTMNSSGRIDNTGIINNLSGGIINLLPPTSFGSGLVNSSGGTLNNFSLISISAKSSLANGSGAIVNNRNVIVNEGAIENAIGGTFNNILVLNSTDSSILTNHGTLTNGNTLISSGTFTNTGSLVNQAGATVQNFGVMNNSGGFSNAGTFEIFNGGVLNNTGAIGNVQGGGFAVLTGGIFNNSATFTSDSVSGFGSQAGSSIFNSGTMSLGGNSIDIGGAFRNNGTINLTPGAISGDPPIQQPPPPLFVASTGSLSGTGVVNGNVFMEGTMSPGDSLGKFTINGNYSQSASGTLDILLGGTGPGQFGQLDILGAADLSGTLDVELFAGFDPQAGDVFEILKAGDINTFDFLKLLFPTVADGLSFKLDLEGNNLFLDVIGKGDSGGGGSNVPEPSTWLLLASGLFAVALAGSARKRVRLSRTECS